MTNENVKSMEILESRICVRLSEKERIEADELVRNRKFRNRSQLIRTALHELLKKSAEDHK